MVFKYSGISSNFSAICLLNLTNSCKIDGFKKKSHLLFRNYMMVIDYGMNKGNF